MGRYYQACLRRLGSKQTERTNEKMVHITVNIVNPIGFYLQIAQLLVALVGAVSAFAALRDLWRRRHPRRCGNHTTK